MILYIYNFAYHMILYIYNLLNYPLAINDTPHQVVRLLSHLHTS